MTFIETIFGLSPDGGSGLLELVLFVIPAAGLLLMRGWTRAAGRLTLRRPVS